ncbi:MAG: excinuclease ABC subunit C [Caulobacterales bacterium 32-69-10]|nr:MAG: excinuclease ABC subunit C [Caulobacterales bacterium 32-69-10]
MGGWVYILASAPYGTLYVGVTNDLARRVWEHREGHGSAFCRKYGVHRLVRVEPYPEIIAAISREKRLKKWPREWKIKLIESENPGWLDLYERINADGMWSPT